MMAPGIAVTLAHAGLRAVLLSRTAEGADKGTARAMQLSLELIENGFAPALPGGAVEGSTDEAASVAAADIVIESVPEDLAMKQELFARWDAIAKPETVLASNTSSLSITAIAARCSRPERVLTTHFWNPPHLMRLVEIVRGERTSDDAAADTKELLRRAGKLPVIVKKDRPGQLGNRLQFALLREAIHIVEEGIADPEDVDAVASNGFGLRLPVYGIFEHQDIVGLKTCKAVMDYVAPDLNSEPRTPRLLDELMAAGHTGAAAGRGLLDWSAKDPDAVRRRRDAFVLEMLKRGNRRE